MIKIKDKSWPLMTFNDLSMISRGMHIKHAHFHYLEIFLFKAKHMSKK